MTTFGGDLLRILAHGVMNTGTAALGQYLGNKFEGERQSKLQGVKELFDQVRNAPDEDTRQSLLGKAYELMGTEAPRVTRTTGYSPPGLEPSVGTPNPMEQLKRNPMNLEGMAGALPMSKTLIAGPTSSLDSLKSKVVTDAMQGIKNPAQRILLPADTKLQETLLAKQIEGEQRADQKELDRQAAMERAKLHADTTAMLGQGMQSLRQQGMQLTLQNQKVLHAQASDRLEASARTQLDKAMVNLEKVTKDPMATESQIKMAIDQYNGVHGSIVAKHPDLGEFFKPLEPELSKGWLGTNIGAGNVVGAKPKAGGAKIIQPSGNQYTLKDKNTGKNVPVTKEVYDAYQKKWGLQ